MTEPAATPPIEPAQRLTAEQIHDQAVKALRTVYDPEIPVDIYELGLVYAIDVPADDRIVVTMTLTAPNCPAAGQLPIDVRERLMRIPGIKDVEVRLTFDPPWTKDMMSEAAKLQLGLD